MYDIDNLLRTSATCKILFVAVTSFVISVLGPVSKSKNLEERHFPAKIDWVVEGFQILIASFLWFVMQGPKSTETSRKKLFVGGLPANIDEAQLREGFSKYGKVPLILSSEYNIFTSISYILVEALFVYNLWKILHYRNDKIGLLVCSELGFNSRPEGNNLISDPVMSLFFIPLEQHTAAHEQQVFALLSLIRTMKILVRIVMVRKLTVFIWIFTRWMML